MLETMYAAPGRGLAAPQVGHAIRLFVMDVAWKTAEPSPSSASTPRSSTGPPSVTGAEGCLSIPGVTAEVPRAPWITCAGPRRIATSREQRLDGAAAICAQHEYDHLDGIVTFDRISSEARRTLEAEYAG
jgi:peptide deformylase